MRKRALVTVAVIALTVIGVSFVARASNDDQGRVIRGGGTTIIEGGTGAPSFDPVITKFAFNWRSGEGHFECLALAPGAPPGDPGSGDFDTNVMYVTGVIDSAQLRGRTAVLQGSATVTGLGAGTGEHFTARVTRGGPGATLVLRVSGLTFREILLEGEIFF